ncbi:vegetative cell wall protein gp1-like [Branchiostoma floridae]|uniref:Vegetative cell wall protein gp1-like n=1 Tax=Branchiostoma floridae TaxID=7739 RepID=A0A9J7L4F5_BRAFL|nr:vegetative cell wall protein gp1-like [Branchiostoma floridae]
MWASVQFLVFMVSVPVASALDAGIPISAILGFGGVGVCWVFMCCFFCFCQRGERERNGPTYPTRPVPTYTVSQHISMSPTGVQNNAFTPEQQPAFNPLYPPAYNPQALPVVSYPANTTAYPPPPQYPPSSAPPLSPPAAPSSPPQDFPPPPVYEDAAKSPPPQPPPPDSP